MKNKNLQVLKKIGDDRYRLTNRLVITLHTDFSNSVQGGMRAHAHDADGKKYELTVYNDKINNENCYFDLDMISYDKPEVFAL